MIAPITAGSFMDPFVILGFFAQSSAHVIALNGAFSQKYIP